MINVAGTGHAVTDLNNPLAGVFLDDNRLRQQDSLLYWPDRVLTDYFDATVRQRPDDEALICHVAGSGAEPGLSYAELNRRVNCIAAGLVRLGVRKGEVISFQLPNCWEFIAIHLACVRLGVVSNPLMPIFRARELKFMITRAGSRILIVPKFYRGFNYEVLAGSLLEYIPMLEHILITGGTGENAFESLYRDQDESLSGEITGMQPNDVMKIMFTSGTTGEPKGVMHTSNTLLSSVPLVAGRLRLGRNDVIFMPSPFAHSIGWCYGMMMSITLGARLVTMDIWDPGIAAHLMEKYAVSFSFGATPFLSDLANLPGIETFNLHRFRVFLTAGAPVPPLLVDEVSKACGTTVVPGYGMTELGLVTTTFLSGAQSARDTVGIPLPCCEVRIVDDSGREQQSRQEGCLQCRGSTTFVGYLRRPDLYDVDEEGWFDTGDIASIDSNGFVRIIGRSKDIIIRGGENIPVFELESLIYEMPQIKEVSITGLADPRLGERACAFVVLHSGRSLCLREVTDFLEMKQVARQYMPERLVILDELPRTPTGKIRKFILREMGGNFKERIETL